MITKAYTTSDGKVFADKTLAKKHDAELTAMRELNEAYESVVRTDRPQSLLLAMVNDPLPALNILRKLVKEAKIKPELMENLPPVFARAA